MLHLLNCMVGRCNARAWTSHQELSVAVFYIAGTDAVAACVRIKPSCLCLLFPRSGGHHPSSPPLVPLRMRHVTNHYWPQSGLSLPTTMSGSTSALMVAMGVYLQAGRVRSDWDVAAIFGGQLLEHISLEPPDHQLLLQKGRQLLFVAAAPVP